MKETKATVVITSYNQKEESIRCLEWIKGISEVANIIIADNASEDGTAEFLSQSGYPYLFFDEGVQGYGTLCNAVIDNFDLEEFIIFMEVLFKTNFNFYIIINNLYNKFHNLRYIHFHNRIFTF